MRNKTKVNDNIWISCSATTKYNQICGDFFLIELWIRGCKIFLEKGFSIFQMGLFLCQRFETVLVLHQGLKHTELPIELNLWRFVTIVLLLTIHRRDVSELVVNLMMGWVLAHGNVVCSYHDNRQYPANNIITNRIYTNIRSIQNKVILFIY